MGRAVGSNSHLSTKPLRRRQPQSPNPSDRVVDGVGKLRPYAFGLVFVVAGLGTGSVLLSDHLPNLVAFAGSASSDLLATLTIGLLVAWFVLVFQWWTATWHEFDLLRDNLEGVFIRSEAVLAIFLLAGGLGIMPILILFDERWFIGFYAVFLALNYGGQRITNRHIRRALEQTPRNGPKAGRVRAIESYYLERPQLARIGVMATVAFVSFVIALASPSLPGATWIWKATALAAVLGDIVVGEAVMYVWRHRRDDVLEAFDDR